MHRRSWDVVVLVNNQPRGNPGEALRRRKDRSMPAWSTRRRATLSDSAGRRQIGDETHGRADAIFPFQVNETKVLT